MADPDFLREEPPTGSAVAIDWGGGVTGHQEVWVSSPSNIGNWYSPDIPMRGDEHPRWEDVLRRAQGRTLTLLGATPEDAYRTGYDAGVSATADALEQAILGARDPEVTRD